MPRAALIGGSASGSPCLHAREKVSKSCLLSLRAAIRAPGAEFFERELEFLPVRHPHANRRAGRIREVIPVIRKLCKRKIGGRRIEQVKMIGTIRTE